MFTKSVDIMKILLMQFSGYSQLRFQSFQETSRKDGFDIRRARLDIRGSLSPYFSYRVQADLAEKPKMIDAYGEIKLTEYI